MSSFYKMFQKMKIYLNILNVKVQMQKKLELKSGYKAFEFFQATINVKQNC